MLVILKENDRSGIEKAFYIYTKRYDLCTRMKEKTRKYSVTHVISSFCNIEKIHITLLEKEPPFSITILDYIFVYVKKCKTKGKLFWCRLIRD